MTFATTTTFDATGLYDRSVRTAPWARFFAKNLDIDIFTVALCIAVGGLGLVNPDSGAWTLVVLLGLAAFPFFESASQFLLGNTLGKKLLGMRVLDKSGGPVSFGTLLQRNYRCYVHGLALGIPIAAFITYILGFVGYTRDGVSSWDHDAGTICANQGASTWRSLLIGCAPFWLPIVLIIIVSASGPSLNDTYANVDRVLN